MVFMSTQFIAEHQISIGTCTNRNETVLRYPEASFVTDRMLTCPMLVLWSRDAYRKKSVHWIGL